MQTANTSVINTMYLDFDVGTQLLKTAGPPMSGMPLWRLACQLKFCKARNQYDKADCVIIHAPVNRLFFTFPCFVNIAFTSQFSSLFGKLCSWGWRANKQNRYSINTTLFIFARCFGAGIHQSGNSCETQWNANSSHVGSILRCSVISICDNVLRLQMQVSFLFK